MATEVISGRKRELRGEKNRDKNLISSNINKVWERKSEKAEWEDLEK